MAIDTINRYLLNPAMNRVVSPLYKMAAPPIASLAQNILKRLGPANEDQIRACCTRLRNRLCPPQNEPERDDEEDLSDGSDGDITPRAGHKMPKWELEMERQVAVEQRVEHRIATIDRPIRELMRKLRTESSYYYALCHIQALKEFIHSPQLEKCTDELLAEIITFCLNYTTLEDEIDFLIDQFNIIHPNTIEPARYLYCLFTGYDQAEFAEKFLLGRDNFAFLRLEEQFNIFEEAVKTNNEDVVEALKPNMLRAVKDGFLNRKKLWNIISSNSIAEASVNLWLSLPAKASKKNS